MRVRIPADVDREDPIVAGLSARQLGLLASAGVVLWLVYEATRTLLPLPVIAALLTPPAAATVMVALGRRDGVPGDRLALAALRHLRSPHRFVPAAEEVVSMRPPGIRETRIARLCLPVRALGSDGILDLGRHGAATVCAASSLSFSLRSADEQNGLVTAFGRFLNSVDGPIQIVVRCGRADLGRIAERIRTAAAGLPHPALERAALAHAAFVDALTAEHNLVRREVFVTLRGSTATGQRVLDRAGEAAAALAAAGIAVSRLDGSAVAAALRRAMDPTAGPLPEGLAAPADVIRRRPA